MKRNQIVLLILLIITLTALIFSFWKISKNSKNSNQIPATTSIMSNSAKSDFVEERAITDKNDFYEISVKYPVDSRDIKKEIETFISYLVENKQQEWKVGGEIYNEEKALSDLYPDRPEMVYSYDISYETFESLNKGTVSYVFTIYQFSGGAHGSAQINTFTFNNEGRVNIEDVLNISENNNDIELSRILAAKIKKEQNGMFMEDMMMEGMGLAYLKADGVTLDKEKCNCDGFFYGSNLQNFYILDEGITFLFNQYQIAPGALGVIKTTLDWETLSPYLKS